MLFNKSPKNYQEQVDLLIARGMHVANSERARRYLSHLNYYRLAAYWLPFEADHTTHQFKLGTSFDQVLESYLFDKQLRLLIMDAIERVEVSLRSQWAYQLAHHYGPHAHLDAKLFKQNWNHAQNIADLHDIVRQSSEVFIRHFKIKYDESLPPVWVICEIMTFGQLSRWYANLSQSRDRNAIARIYYIDETVLVSFMHHLSTVRNFTAHHSRVWNRDFTIAWKLPLHGPAAVIGSLNRQDSKRIYNTLAMLACLIDVINPGNHWKQRLANLFKSYSRIQPRFMGFPENWRELPLWKGNV